MRLAPLPAFHTLAYMRAGSRRLSLLGVEKREKGHLWSARRRKGGGGGGKMKGR